MAAAASTWLAAADIASAQAVAADQVACTMQYDPVCGEDGKTGTLESREGRRVTTTCTGDEGAPASKGAEPPVKPRPS